jgi:ketosteroid isomerase-like protein
MLRTPVRIVLMSLVLPAVLICAAAQPVSASQARRGAQPRANIEEQVLQASNAWADALYRNDVEAVDRLLADDFVTIQQAGTSMALIEKSVQLDSLRKTGASRPKFKRQLSRTRVKSFGNVAILTALASYEIESATAPPQKAQALISEVWVNSGGMWRLTHFQPTAMLTQAPR